MEQLTGGELTERTDIYVPDRFFITVFVPSDVSRRGGLRVPS